jgi:hypothetical protein
MMTFLPILYTIDSSVNHFSPSLQKITYNTKYVHKKSTTVYAPRRNWDSPNPGLGSACCPPPQKQGGGGTLACGWGVGGESQFRRGAYTVVLFICTYFVTYNKFYLPKKTVSSLSYVYLSSLGCPACLSTCLSACYPVHCHPGVCLLICLSLCQFVAVALAVYISVCSSLCCSACLSACFPIHK